MGKFVKNLHNGDSVRKRVQELFGMDDDHLVKELETAQREKTEADGLKPPADEFEKIMAELERRGEKTRIEAELKGERVREFLVRINKPIFLFYLVLIVAAATLAATAAEDGICVVCGSPVCSLSIYGLSISSTSIPDAFVFLLAYPA